MELELRRIIGALLDSGTSKEHWLQLAGSAWDLEHAKAQLNSPQNAASSVPIATPSCIASTPALTSAGDAAQYACPRCTGKFGKAKIFPRKAELIRHINHTCEQTIEMICGEADCPAKLTRTDHFKEHLRKAHRLPHSEVKARAGTATIIKLPQRTALGCGFCRAAFVNDPEAYGEHIAGHFTHGLTIDEWSPTKQILSLLYQSANVWRVWMEVIDEQMPGRDSPEQYVNLTKETAASFVGMLEKGLDAEIMRPVLWRLFFTATLNEQMQSGRLVAPCQASSLGPSNPGNDASSVDSGYGASSGQTSLRTFGSDLRASAQTLATMSSAIEYSPSSLIPHEQPSFAGHCATSAMSTDLKHRSHHFQTSWLDDTDHDTIMHDIPSPPDIAPAVDHSVPSTVLESTKRKSHGHRRSASEKLRGMWNEARRSLGLAGPSDA